MGYIQLSLFGKTSWERFLQMTGWILEPSCNHFPIPKFQCLLLEDGLTPVWCEGERLTCAGGSWMPSIGESPGLLSEERESSLWQILRGQRSAEILFKPRDMFPLPPPCTDYGCPPPEPVEYLLIKQGGKYPSSAPFRNGVCGWSEIRKPVCFPRKFRTAR